MEEYIPGKNANKRSRENSALDSVFDSGESKRVHIETNAGSSLVQLNRVELKLAVIIIMTRPSRISMVMSARRSLMHMMQTWT